VLAAPIGIYRVAGSRAYRGHEPGTEFGARLEPLAEARAIRRGSIELVDRMTPELERGSFSLPREWQTTKEDGRK
jgi:hypothetical protein